jgi:Protein of unknown function (DUF4254)
VTPVQPDIPTAASVVALFQLALRNGEPVVADGVVQVLLDLHRNNVEQWKCEDTTRDAGASDATVVAAKRAIDAHNARRHRLVEAIDAAFADVLRQDDTAMPATESPAMVFDRLSVLCIRLHVIETSSDDERSAERVQVVRDQLATLQEALDGLLDEIRAGRKRFVPYQSLKLYGTAPTPGAPTADTRRD